MPWSAFAIDFPGLSIVFGVNRSRTPIASRNACANGSVVEDCIVPEPS
jgi:hypothetical protein